MPWLMAKKKKKKKKSANEFETVGETSVEQCAQPITQRYKCSTDSSATCTLRTLVHSMHGPIKFLRRQLAAWRGKNTHFFCFCLNIVYISYN